MSKTNSIILIDKFGKLKTLQINTKDFNKNDLYKKCGFKNDSNYSKQAVWKVTIEKQKYVVSVYAKTDGRANMENKYDFPPPIDNTLFFGTCAILCEIRNENDDSYKLSDLSISLWDKIYEKLFGGFENLNDTALNDENEEDELLNVKAEKKTKQGYLKDGFVVDDKSDEEEDDDEEDDNTESEDDDVDEENDDDDDDDDDDEIEDDIEDDIDEEIEDDIVEDLEEDIEEEDEEEDEDGNIIKKKYKSKKPKKTNTKLNIKSKAVVSKNSKKGKSNKKNNDIIEDLILEDLTTELSEEEYDYSDK